MVLTTTPLGITNVAEGDSYLINIYTTDFPDGTPLAWLIDGVDANDLVTPRPEYSFPGLVPGDRWCLCAARWLEAFQAGCAPGVVLAATSDKALEIVPFELLKQHAA
ncbi:MAG: DUF2237 family protein [Planctomycetia bacterium]|nr:DUF2237 family protein [Planctomycetia bacterium]